MTTDHRVAAIIGVVTEVNRAVIYLLFLGVGGWFILQGLPLRNPGTAVVLVAAESLTLANSCLNYWLARYLVRIELARLAAIGDPQTILNAQEDLFMGAHRREIEEQHLQDQSDKHDEDMAEREGQYQADMADQRELHEMKMDEQHRKDTE